MHTILLVLPKPDRDRTATELAWKAVGPDLQQRATQAGGVKTLFENCWLIPAEENGLSFFGHAITVADGLKLRCRICLLSTPPNGTVRESPESGLKNFCGAAARRLQCAVRLVHKLFARCGLAG